MKITRKSILTQNESTMDLPITLPQWKLWTSPNPPLIQECFPNLTADEREFVLTGITSNEWNDMVKEEEDDSINEHSKYVGC